MTYPSNSGDWRFWTKISYMGFLAMIKKVGAISFMYLVMIWLNIYIINQMIWLKDQNCAPYFVHINPFINSRNIFSCPCAGITEFYKDNFLPQGDLEFW